MDSKRGEILDAIDDGYADLEALIERHDDELLIKTATVLIRVLRTYERDSTPETLERIARLERLVRRDHAK